MTSNGQAAEFGRTPPHDLAAEQGALGGMMLSRDAITDVMQVIGPVDHYRPAHQMIHQAIIDLDAAGEPADVITVAALLVKRGEFAQAGGGPYLHTLVASAGSHAFAGSYARTVREKAILRRLAEEGTRIVQLAYEGADDADMLAQRAREMIDSAAAPDTQAGALPSMGEAFAEAVTSLDGDQPLGLPTGWADLDQAINGFGPGQLWYIAGRPQSGKSLALLGIAAHAAIRQEVPVLLASMEMSRLEITLRLISAEARVPLRAMLRRELDDRQVERIMAVQDRITGAPLLIDDTPACSLVTLRSRLRDMARATPAGLLLVDYIQLMQEPSRAENRQTAVSALSRGLKLLAGEHGIPVVAAAQLNRSPEHRSGGIPQLSDLRESGSLEQDAFGVVLIHRPDLADPDSPRTGEVDLIVAKNRNGGRATVRLAFQGHYARMMSMAPEDSGRDWSPSSVLAGSK